MRNKSIVLYLFMSILLVSCSHRYTQNSFYAEKIDFDRNLVYVFIEKGKSEPAVYYSLVGTTFGRQLLIISTIKDKVLTEDLVYVIKTSESNPDDGLLHDNKPAHIFPLYSVEYRNNDYHIDPPSDNNVKGLIVKNGSSLSLSLLNEKRKDLAMIDYAKADEAFPFDIKLFADNEDFHHSMTWFFTLIGKNVFVSTEIVGGITELKYFWIDRRNETDYIKPMYMVSFYKSDRDRQGDNLFDNGLISVAISSDNETYNNEFIIKKNSSIVYWASGLKDELDCHEKEIIDYNKIKPVRYSIPKNPLRF